VETLEAKVQKLRDSHEEKRKIVAMLEDQTRHINNKQEEKDRELNQVERGRQVEHSESVSQSWLNSGLIQINQDKTIYCYFIGMNDALRAG
jgi:hypothetical protein